VKADDEGVDPVLSRLDESDFDALWLFAVDIGDGLSTVDCEGISRFRKRGGGIFSLRDHADLGSSLCTLGGIGAAHYFHSRNLDPDPSHNVRDDPYTTNIDFPNYHSGANGDYHEIKVLTDHDLLRRPDGSMIRIFPLLIHTRRCRRTRSIGACDRNRYQPSNWTRFQFDRRIRAEYR
jgi:hypothetical protein